MQPSMALLRNPFSIRGFGIKTRGFASSGRISSGRTEHTDAKFIQLFPSSDVFLIHNDQSFRFFVMDDLSRLSRQVLSRISDVDPWSSPIFLNRDASKRQGSANA